MRRFPKLSKKVLILSGIVIIIVIATIVIVVYRDSNNTVLYDASEVEYLEVESSLPVPATEFCSNTYVVKEPDNIADIIKSINEQDNEKIEYYKFNDPLAICSSKVSIYMKNGTMKECIWKYVGGDSLDPYLGMQTFFNRKEIIYQVSAILNLDRKDVSRAEVYYFSHLVDEDRVVLETFADSESLDLLIELTQKDYLENPTKLLGDTFCGIYFYNKDGEIVAEENFTRDSAYYDDFVTKIPEIKEYLK